MQECTISLRENGLIAELPKFVKGPQEDPGFSLKELAPTSHSPTSFAVFLLFRPSRSSNCCLMQFGKVAKVFLMRSVSRTIDLFRLTDRGRTWIMIMG